MNPVAKETRFDRVVIGDSLARVHAVTGRAFVVALDGPGGSGKSTLAREVVAAYDGPAAVVEGDDFYADLDDDYRAGLDARGGYREYFDWQRLRDQVFLPARQGRPVSYQRYDWGHARMGDWLTVPGVELLLVEGVYSSRPELSEYADLVLWVATSEEERIRRQLERCQNGGIWISRFSSSERSNSSSRSS